MSTRRTRPSTHRTPQPRGPDGTPLCRWCGGPLPPRRSSFCSDACVHQHLLRSDPGYLRRAVFARDRGFCSDCGLDTEALRKSLRKAPEADRGARLEALGFPPHRSTLWDAHHLVAVRDGGGESGLDGFVTLCVPCHQEVTARQQRRWAQQRRAGEGGDEC